MSILSVASNASAWRGYEYYEKKKVLFWKQTGVCKHKVALFFTVFPKEADRYKAEIEEYANELLEAEERDRYRY
jgi:hypothetical protein